MQALLARLSSSSGVLRKKKARVAAPVGADGEAHRNLGHHKTVAQSLVHFCRDFAEGLDKCVAAIGQLLEVIRTAEPMRSGEDQDAYAMIHAWALAMGVKATAPCVGKRLQRHVGALERLAEAAEAGRSLLEQKSVAQQERNHYMLKLQMLYEDRDDRRRQGKSCSSEQLAKLARNEEKLARAEHRLEDCARAAAIALSNEIEQSRASVLSELHEVAQVVACAWFVSTGAVICRAIQTAESAASAATTAAGEDKFDKPTTPPSRMQLMDGVVVLPQTVDPAKLDLPGTYNPADPLSPTGVAMPEPTGLARPLNSEAGDDAKTLPTDEKEGEPQVQPGTSHYSSLPVRRLRELLRQRGVSDAGCTEKQELIALLCSESDGSLADCSRTSSAVPGAAQVEPPEPFEGQAASRQRGWSAEPDVSPGLGSGMWSSSGSVPSPFGEGSAWLQEFSPSASAMPPNSSPWPAAAPQKQQQQPAPWPSQPEPWPSSPNWPPMATAHPSASSSAAGPGGCNSSAADGPGGVGNSGTCRATNSAPPAPGSPVEWPPASLGEGSSWWPPAPSAATAAVRASPQPESAAFSPSAAAVGFPAAEKDQSSAAVAASAAASAAPFPREFEGTSGAACSRSVPFSFFPSRRDRGADSAPLLSD